MIYTDQPISIRLISEAYYLKSPPCEHVQTLRYKTPRTKKEQIWSLSMQHMRRFCNCGSTLSGAGWRYYCNAEVLWHVFV